jgi:hypothetical protein
VLEDHGAPELLTADYTYLNERPAQHYGIPNVYGPHFRRVQLQAEERRGLLGKAGILLVTSYPNRTSPVQRGKWLLENLLGAPPPPPPPNVPSLQENTPGEVHYPCATHGGASSQSGLHRMPLGYGSAGIRAGKLRRDLTLAQHGEGSAPIDASGEL